MASSRLPEKTALGALWPLLAEAEPQPLSGGGEDRSLLITAETSMWAGGIPAMFVSNLPDWLARDVEMPPPYVATLGANYAAQADAVHTFLSRYPALSRCSPFRASGEPIGMYLHDDGTCSVLLQWDKQDVATASFAAVAASIGVRSRDGWRVYPSLDGGERPVHPLVVWWAVLFRLSMLARYEPEQWDRLTDVNSSRDAVPVEHLLREALSAVPALVFEVLTADHASTYPGLVPITGGTDYGLDAEIGTDDRAVGVVITSSRTWDGARRSLRGSLESMRRHGRGVEYVIAANLAEVNRRRRDKLQAIAAEFECELLQVHDRAWFTEQFRANPDWRSKILAIEGRPFSFSREPRGALPDERQLPSVGRDHEIYLADHEPGDLIIWGVPGVGKSHVAARLSGALFLEDPVDPQQLLDDLISAAPDVVVVDDAGGRIQDLRTLLRVRAAEGMRFRIATTCWPHETDHVADVLVDATKVHVDLLSREDMGKLLRLRGITRVAVLAHLLDQAQGRPAWALRLADLLVRHGDWQSVWTGDALRAQVLTALRRLNAPDDAREILGCIALVGRIDEDQAHRLANLLQLRYATFLQLLRSVAIAGLVDVQQRHAYGTTEPTLEQTFEVAPRVVAGSLASEVFFSSHPSPVRLRDLKEAIPEAAAQVVQHQIYARLTGAPRAVVPSDAEVLDLLAGGRHVDHNELLRTYAAIGRPQAAFVSGYLVSRIEDACHAGNPATAVKHATLLATHVAERLDASGAADLDRLFGVLEELAARDWHTDSIVEALVDAARAPLSGDLPDVDELAGLLELIGHKFPDRLSDTLWVGLACEALKPIFDDNYMSPEVHRQVVLRSFAWPADDMVRLFEAMRPELVRRAPHFTRPQASRLLDLLGKWVRLADGRGLPYGGNVSAEQQRVSREIATALAQEVAHAVRSPGLRAKFNEVTHSLGMLLEEPDPLFASLVADRHHRVQRRDRDKSARVKETALTAALQPYLDQDPAVLMAWIDEHREDLSTLRNGTAPSWIMRHIARLPDVRPGDWLEAAAKAGLARFAGAFMDRCLETDSLTGAMAEQLMSDPDSRATFIEVVLAERPEPIDGRIVEAVISQLTVEDVAMLDESLALHGIDEHTRRLLFTHRDSAVRSTAAAVWIADHAYDDGLPDDGYWVEALSELALPNDMLKPHTQAQTLSALVKTAPGAYADLLAKHAEQVERRGRVDFAQWEDSAQQLSNDERDALWNRVSGTRRAREIFWVLAGQDVEWVKKTVGEPGFAFTADALVSATRYQVNPRFSLRTLAEALRPLGWEPDDIVWTLDVGTMTGEDHERYARHVETCRVLAASEEPDIARLGARGVEIFEARLAQAEAEAHWAAVRGVS